MRDTYHNLKFVPAIAPVTITDNTPLVGAIVSNAGFQALTYAIQTGVLADVDATFVALLEESDAADLSGSNPVADSDMLGTELLAGFTFADDTATRKLGYIGNKLYTRLTITPTGNTGSAPISAMAVLSHANVRPMA
ncbi:hypothetical protein [Bradyrhizobium sp. S69]|uniref:hypothetical protein n=1 Tax=Bradyrhizobium sp. S69 TaxID=1641856 RepID=UPI00131BFC5E|nr:hypothetical protein [Bradyrhizobium sp. S69]